MGADIHIHIEYKVGDKPWEADKAHEPYEDDGHTYVDTFGSRDYNLFAALAGVRGDGPDPLGLPDDVSPTVQLSSDRWDSDGHSHSYHSLEDFIETLTQCEYDLSEPVDSKKTWNYSYHEIVNKATANVKKFKLDLEAEQMLLDQPINTEVKCRLVYFFDN